MIETIVKLQAWSKKNFPYATPEECWWGLVEELGEYAHATLKGKQKIRGFSDPQKVTASQLDAIADAAVFAIDLCTRKGMTAAEVETAFLFARADRDVAGIDITPEGPMQSVVMRGVLHFIALDGVERYDAVTIFSGLKTLAAMHGADLAQIVDNVYETTLRHRDWVANPTGALQ